MARTPLSPELKKAISLLPSKEKDKLLWRLIAKDAMLTGQLEFRLLEGGETTEERRDEVREQIERSLDNYYYYSPGYLLLELRSLSGIISHHVRTTRDKYGEIELNFLMLNKSHTLFNNKLRQASAHKATTFNDYVIKRALKLLQLLSKLHEDYRLDFQPAMQELGNHFKHNPTLMKTTTYHGLDVNWLLNGEVPE